MGQTGSSQMKCKPLVVGAAEVTQLRPGGDRGQGLAGAHTALSHVPGLLSQCISTEAREALRCQLLLKFLECVEPQNKICAKDKLEPVIFFCRKVSVALCSC